MMFAEDNRAFVAAQRAEPDYALAARAANQLLDDLDIRFRTLPYYFRIDAQTHADLARATRLLVSAQQKVARHLVATRDGDELAALFEVPAGMAAHFNWADLAAPGAPMLRADIIPTADGYYFCELNHFSGVGAGESFHSARAFAELLGRPVAGISPFRQLAYQYVTQCRREGLSRVVILDSTKHRAQGFGEQLMLARYLRLLAPDLEVSYRDELTYPAEWQRPEEARRTLIHRIITYEDTPDEGAFLAVLRDGGARYSCWFEAELMMHRKWFSLLCDPAGQTLFDDEERAAITRYVPHTFDVAGNLDEVLADKDNLVFKRSYTYGGKGVLIGDEHSPDELRALLTADQSNWIAQRRVYTSSLELPVAGEMVPFFFVLGVFMYGDNTSGVLVRASARSSVVNVSRGGGASWAFIH